ncbi:Abi family protein [Mannheimia indoligenes]|uniref:Abi family protein n=1 Tax=Mannheimia indoligenes TaxID=3103145 RepID=UPI002FE54CC0
MLNLYIFDRELRLIVLDAIERIEVSIRTKISNEMSIQSQNPFWYIKEDYFQNKSLPPSS